MSLQQKTLSLLCLLVAQLCVGQQCGFVKISCGMTHSIGIKSGGTLWAWGDNTFGSLGDGTQTQRNAPVQIGTGTNWASVSAGTGFSLGIKTDGTLWAWGSNFSGQLGNPSVLSLSTTPVQIGTDTDWASVDAGASHSLGIKKNGTLWGWGSNSYGQLGDGSTTAKIAPLQIGTGTNWKSISSGNEHSLGIKKDGSLWAWGRNLYGQLIGNGSFEDQYTPLQIGTSTNWASVFASNEHSLAIQTNGTLWAWGVNSYGQLGDGTNVGKNTPIQIGTDTHWTSIAAGVSHSVGLKTDGTIWAWGSSGEGQLGNGSFTNKNTPTQMGTGTNWSSVTSGLIQIIGTLNDGAIWAWGGNSTGQLGDGSTTRRTSPVEINIKPSPPNYPQYVAFCQATTPDAVNKYFGNTENVKWYTNRDGTDSLSHYQLLTSGVYYLSRTVGGCESPKVTITIEIESLQNPSIYYDASTPLLPGSARIFSIKYSKGHIYSWSATGNPKMAYGSSESEISISWSTPGDYVVTVKDSSHCGSTYGSLKVTVTYATTVDESQAALGRVSIYPNPAQKNSTLSIEGLATDVKLQMLTSTGDPITVLLTKEAFESYKMDFPAGMYFVRIIEPAIGKSACRRIVIE